MARTIEQAEDSILRFIAHSIATNDERMRVHTHDYDIYLPWLLEVVTYKHISSDQAPPSLTELAHLYMDAAWSLVTRGLLRPGPRNITSIDTADGFGKGYSLTQSGQKRVQEINVDDLSATASLRSGEASIA